MNNKQQSDDKKLLRMILRTIAPTLAATSNCPIPSATQVMKLREKVRADLNNIDLNTELSEVRFVIFDTETTGLHPFAGDEVISIGAVVVQDCEVKYKENFHQLVKPYRPIPRLATEINGISDDMVEDAPCIFTGIEKFLDFADKSVLIAHNADFDLNFLNLKLKKYCKTKIQHQTLDTMTLGMALYPALRDYSLDTLALRHEVPIIDRHHALGDSIITGNLFVKYLDILKQRGIHTLKDLYSFLHWRSFI